MPEKLKKEKEQVSMESVKKEKLKKEDERVKETEQVSVRVC